MNVVDEQKIERQIATNFHRNSKIQILFMHASLQLNKNDNVFSMYFSVWANISNSQIRTTNKQTILEIETFKRKKRYKMKKFKKTEK